MIPTLIVGGQTDFVQRKIVPVLNRHGMFVSAHWDYDRKQIPSFPKMAERVVAFTDMVSHAFVQTAAREAAARGLRICYASRKKATLERQIARVWPEDASLEPTPVDSDPASDDASGEEEAEKETLADAGLTATSPAPAPPRRTSLEEIGALLGVSTGAVRVLLKKDGIDPDGPAAALEEWALRMSERAGPAPAVAPPAAPPPAPLAPGRPTCSAKGCTKPLWQQGFCIEHHRQVFPRPAPQVPTCRVTGCTERTAENGMCAKHAKMHRAGEIDDQGRKKIAAAVAAPARPDDLIPLGDACAMLGVSKQQSHAEVTGRWGVKVYLPDPAKPASRMNPGLVSRREIEALLKNPCHPGAPMNQRPEGLPEGSMTIRQFADSRGVRFATVWVAMKTRGIDGRRAVPGAGKDARHKAPLWLTPDEMRRLCESAKPAPRPPPAPTPAPTAVPRLQRGETARRIGVSIATVRRLEKSGELHPVVEHGMHLFDPAEVGRVATEYRKKAPVPVPVPAPAPAAAKASGKSGIAEQVAMLRAAGAKSVKFLPDGSVEGVF